MPRFGSFHYWISVTSDPDGSFTSFYNGLINSSDQALVVETGITSDSIPDTLTEAQLGNLATRGHSMIGYVNVAVPDHNRSYWNPGWVTPFPDDPANADFGTLTEEAPAWLVNNLGLATGPDDETFGFIVDFADPEWRQIVIDQAVAVIESGYSGVFLDDVGRYFIGSSADIVQQGRDMKNLVNDIADAVHAVNPDAVIGINGGGYLRWDSVTQNSGTWWEFLGNVDFLVSEYVDPAFSPIDWTEVTDNYRDLIDFVFIVDDSLAAGQTDFELTGDAAVRVEVVPNPNYASAPPVGPLPPPPTITNAFTFTTEFSNGSGRTIAFGTEEADEFVAPAQDTGMIIYGGDGDDILRGTAGDDLIFGGAGNDTIFGGGGNDTIIGGAGQDEVFGEAGDDVLSGGPDGDALSGGDGDDLLYGSDLPDEFLF